MLPEYDGSAPAGFIHILFARLLLIWFHPSDARILRDDVLRFCPSCMLLLLTRTIDPHVRGKNEAAINSRCFPDSNYLNVTLDNCVRKSVLRTRPECKLTSYLLYYNVTGVIF